MIERVENILNSMGQRRMLFIIGDHLSGNQIGKGMFVVGSDKIQMIIMWMWVCTLRKESLMDI